MLLNIIDIFDLLFATAELTKLQWQQYQISFNNSFGLPSIYKLFLFQLYN
jgi:hypothetical protein